MHDKLLFRVSWYEDVYSSSSYKEELYVDQIEVLKRYIELSEDTNVMNVSLCVAKWEPLSL